MARMFALLLGSFALMNLLGGLFRPQFDGNGLWIDLGFLPGVFASALLLGSSALLIAFAAGEALPLWQRNLSALIFSVLALATAWNAITFFRLQHAHFIAARIPVPLSLIVALVLVFLIVALFKPEWRGGALNLRTCGAAFALGLLLFPLAQMYFFGKTDYRRHADAIVVFGARAYADGRPSQALADRVRTACELYREGYAPKLILSGGPGDGAIDEPEAMRRLALTLGVRDADLILDPAGLNTHATVANTRLLFEKWGFHRVLAVSHFYHLPRVKLAYQHASLMIYTVPARETYTLTKMPLLMAREVAAYWSYFAKVA